MHTSASTHAPPQFTHLIVNVHHCHEQLPNVRPHSCGGRGIDRNDEQRYYKPMRIHRTVVLLQQPQL